MPSQIQSGQPSQVRRYAMSLRTGVILDDNGNDVPVKPEDDREEREHEDDERETAVKAAAEVTEDDAVDHNEDVARQAEQAALETASAAQTAEKKAVEAAQNAQAANNEVASAASETEQARVQASEAGEQVEIAEINEEAAEETALAAEKDVEQKKIILEVVEDILRKAIQQTTSATTDEESKDIKTARKNVKEAERDVNVAIAEKSSADQAVEEARTYEQNANQTFEEDTRELQTAQNNEKEAVERARQAEAKAHMAAEAADKARAAATETARAAETVRASETIRAVEIADTASAADGANNTENGSHTDGIAWDIVGMSDNRYDHLKRILQTLMYNPYYQPDRDEIDTPYVQHVKKKDGEGIFKGLSEKKQGNPDIDSECERHAFFLYCVHRVYVAINKSADLQKQMSMSGSDVTEFKPFIRHQISARHNKMIEEWEADTDYIVPWQLMICIYHASPDSAASLERLHSWMDLVRIEWDTAKGHIEKYVQDEQDNTSGHIFSPSEPEKVSGWFVICNQVTWDENLAKQQPRQWDAKCLNPFLSVHSMVLNIHRSKDPCRDNGLWGKYVKFWSVQRSFVNQHNRQKNTPIMGVLAVEEEEMRLLELKKEWKRVCQYYVKLRETFDNVVKQAVDYQNSWDEFDQHYQMIHEISLRNSDNGSLTKHCRRILTAMEKYKAATAIADIGDIKERQKQFTTKVSQWFQNPALQIQMKHLHIIVNHYGYTEPALDNGNLIIYEDASYNYTFTPSQTFQFIEESHDLTETMESLMRSQMDYQVKFLAIMRKLVYEKKEDVGKLIIDHAKITKRLDEVDEKLKSEHGQSSRSRGESRAESRAESRQDVRSHSSQRHRGKTNTGPSAGSNPWNGNHNARANNGSSNAASVSDNATQPPSSADNSTKPRQNHKPNDATFPNKNPNSKLPEVNHKLLYFERMPIGQKYEQFKKINDDRQYHMIQTMLENAKYQAGITNGHRRNVLESSTIWQEIPWKYRTDKYVFEDDIAMKNFNMVARSNGKSVKDVQWKSINKAYLSRNAKQINTILQTLARNYEPKHEETVRKSEPKHEETVRKSEPKHEKTILQMCLEEREGPTVKKFLNRLTNSPKDRIDLKRQLYENVIKEAEESDRYINFSPTDKEQYVHHKVLERLTALSEPAPDQSDGLGSTESENAQQNELESRNLAGQTNTTTPPKKRRGTKRGNSTENKDTSTESNSDSSSQFLRVKGKSSKSSKSSVNRTSVEPETDNPPKVHARDNNIFERIANTKQKNHLFV